MSNEERQTIAIAFTPLGATFVLALKVAHDKEWFTYDDVRQKQVALDIPADSHLYVEDKQITKACGILINRGELDYKWEDETLYMRLSKRNRDPLNIDELPDIHGRVRASE